MNMKNAGETASILVLEIKDRQALVDALQDFTRSEQLGPPSAIFGEYYDEAEGNEAAAIYRRSLLRRIGELSKKLGMK